MFFSEKKPKKSPSIKIKKLQSAKAPATFKKPIRILLLGSDSRTYSIKGSRSDSIILLQVNPDHSAQMISFPRDSEINIPGRGSNKINSALAFGGPESTVKAIEQYSGLKIHYYVVASFPGLRALINDVGGVKIYVDMSIKDPFSGANVQEGKQVLNGGQALAFARARHNTPNGDFTRADHQQDIAEAVLIQEKKKRRTLDKMVKLVPLILRETETDLSNTELFQLIRSALAVRPSKVSKTVLKGGTGMSGGASVVFIDREFANKAFNKMKAKEK